MEDPRAIIAREPMHYRQVLTVATATALNALDGFDVLSISFASPGIAHDWGITRAALGVVLSMELIGMGIGAFLLGNLADRIGRRPTILTCLVIMGIGMGQAIGAAVETGHPVLAIEGDSAFGFSGMEVETICRYNLPVCVVVFNNNGIYRGTDVNPTGGSDVAPTIFVKDSRYEKMMEAFGGVGVNVTSPDALSQAVNEAMDSGRPTLVNAVIDEAAGTESGRIGNLNPQSVVSKK